MGERLRIGLCDDHGVVRSGLRRILTDEQDIDVVGEAATAQEAVDLACAQQPDVLVLDIGLPDTSGLLAVARIREASPATKVLMLTMHDDIAYLRRAFDAGASGYLLKEAADIELVLAVRQVAAGHQYVHPSLGASLLAPDTPSPRPAGPGGELSERELDVLRLVALGLTNAEIGGRLYVSIRTVETHRAHIQQKLNVHSRAELVRLAQHWGLLEDESDSS